MTEYFVTKPSLPNIDLAINDLKDIWDKKVLTNNGPYNQLFEKKLSELVKTKHAITFANATLALDAAIIVNNFFKPKIITTPFSFVATSSVITTNKMIPIYLDIDPLTGNINSSSCENYLRSHNDVSAIIPVHVYGIPCNLEKLDKLSKNFNIPIIYDAAHTIGSKYDQNIYSFGQCSIVSFHATKVLNTFEGGAIFTNDDGLAKKLRLFRNFGFTSEIDVEIDGLNSKLNEFSAAVGIRQLDELGSYVAKRRRIADYYYKYLSDVPEIKFMITNEFQEKYKFISGFNYFPIIAKNRDDLYEYLKEKKIFVRRYFYPLITSFKPYKKFIKDDIKNATDLSNKILCLPIYTDIDHTDIKIISNEIVNFYKN